MSSDISRTDSVAARSCVFSHLSFVFVVVYHVFVSVWAFLCVYILVYTVVSMILCSVLCLNVCVHIYVCYSVITSTFPFDDVLDHTNYTIFRKLLVPGYLNWYSQVSYTQIHEYIYTNTQIQHMTKCQKGPTCGIFLKRGLFKDIKYDIPLCQTRIYRNTNTKYTNSANDEVPERPNMWYIFSYASRLKRGLFKDWKIIFACVKCRNTKYTNAAYIKYSIDSIDIPVKQGRVFPVSKFRDFCVFLCFCACCVFVCLCARHFLSHNCRRTAPWYPPPTRKTAPLQIRNVCHPIAVTRRSDSSVAILPEFCSCFGNEMKAAVFTCHLYLSSKFLCEKETGKLWDLGDNVK